MKVARHPSRSWIATELDVLGQDYTKWDEGPAEIIVIAKAMVIVIVIVIAVAVALADAEADAEAEAEVDGPGRGSFVAAGCKSE